MEEDGGENGDLTGPSLSTCPLQKEVYFLIAKFLAGGPCERASQVLVEELERNEIIPKSVNWLGNQISQDFKTFSSKFEHISSDYLPKLLDQLLKTINTKSTSKVVSRSLLSHSTLSLIGSNRRPENGSSSQSWCKRFGHLALLRTAKGCQKFPFNPVQAIADRAVGGKTVTDSLISPEFYKNLGVACNTLGHLSAVYCVLFDISGKYIFTGADDHLVKIWSALDGRLISTLRGTLTEVADLSVNQENTMLAVASVDKIIRVWCLQTGEPIITLTGQGGNTTSIFFCPIPRSRSQLRYLASTSTDGSCAFWAYTDNPGEPVVFQPKPTLYLERMRPGNAKMICSSFSPGGLFMAAGSADNHVRVYHMIGQDGPERILEVEYHTDMVDSISWAHQGLRFVSGSKDGTALIWRFEEACWRYIRLYCSKTIGETPMVYEDAKRRPRVTMVGWNADDSLVLTAVSDFMIRVWNSKTGELVRVLKEHNDGVYVIEAHPTNPRIVCTAGHDGKLIVWDIGTRSRSDPSERIFQYYNQLDEAQGHGCLFDCKWSPDGFSLAVTDSHGHLLIFTIDAKTNPRFKKLPKEMFFHTDYRPIIRDAITNEILDEQTQVAPHLMPPPFLVNVDGNPYPPELQRLVPGREYLHEDSLIPIVAVSERGLQEVIQGLPQLGGPARSNIDEMIQQLARAQDGGRAREEREEERRGVGHRRSGEVEGVRQARNWQTVNASNINSRSAIISRLPEGVLQSSENKLLGVTEAEESWFEEHLYKIPTHPDSSNGIPAALGSPGDRTAQGRSRRIRRLAAQAAEQRQVASSHVESFSQLEGVARPNPRPQQEISVSVNQVASPRRTVRPPPPRRRGVNTAPRRGGDPDDPNSNRSSRPIRYDVRRLIDLNGSDIENVDFNDSSSEANVNLTTSASSSSSSDSDDSDWGGNLGASRRRKEQENKRKVDGEGRTRAARTNSNSSPEEASEGDETEQRNLNSSSEPRPGPSSEITAALKAEPGTKQNRPRKTKQKVDYGGGMDEIEPTFRPSEWLSEVMPQRSPYFPQLGDDLVYFRQGHEKYIKFVEDNNLYTVNPKMKKTLPFAMKPGLEAEVSARVVGIKFELEPPRVAILKLARTEWESGELLRDHFYVKYHDVPMVVDFLILRHLYDRSTRRKWNEGDRFRCLIEREWWLGTVTKFEPHSEEFPNSNYLCYKVHWDNGDPEIMSPWDMETIPDDFVIPPDGKAAIAASNEDMVLGMYEPVPSDWPPHGHQDAQCQKLSSLLEQVMALAVAEAFSTPVDLNLYPDYAYQIEYPVDLSTIKARLENRFYRRIDALKYDFTYIAMNAEKFNQPGSQIVQHAKTVRDVCFEILANPDVTSVNPIYHKISKNHAKNEETSEAKKTSKQSSSSKHATPHKASSSQSTNQPGSSSKRSRRSRHEENDDDDEEEEDRDWQHRCYDLLSEIWKKKDAVVFREPVDIIEYPEYYQIIDTPMDLGSVREDLMGGNYQTIQDFHKDMMLIFSNSKQFNEEKSQIYAMTCRLQSLYECQIKLLLKKRRTKRKTKKSKKASRSSSHMPSRINTPRKNPTRSATARKYSHSDESSDEEEPRRDDHDQGRSFTRIQRATRTGHKTLSNGNGHAKGMSSASGSARSSRVNGHSSSAVTTPSRTSTGSSRHSVESSAGHSSTRRPVKKLRLSSESPKRETRSATTHSPSKTTTPKKHRIQIKDEPESEYNSENEAVSGHMPTLNKAEDDDYRATDEESDDEHEHNVPTRRSNRVRPHHSEDYSYETRNRGRATKNYTEPQEASDDDDGRYGKRRRVVSSSSPTRNTRSHPSSEPPALRRPKRILSEDSDDPDQPGPSSKLLRQGSSRSSSIKASRAVRVEVEEDEEEEEGTENESESEDEENSDESNDDDEGKHAKRGLRSRKPLRPRQDNSDDDDYEEKSTRKSKSRTSNPRRATRGVRQDYAENSDSEPQVSITVSSRGRVRKTKSFTGD